MSQLRGYQSAGIEQINGAWDRGVQNILKTGPTGSGKTVEFSHILQNHNGVSVAIAHRQELVSQISMSLAHEEVGHDIIAPRPTIKWIQKLHREEFGQSFYDPGAKTSVAGKGTLVARADQLGNWPKQVGLWVLDEAHHCLRENTWGTAVDLFPNARGLGVTATACRADGKGLGRHADGVFDELILGPSMRELIDHDPQYLCDYEIWAPPSDLDLSEVEVSSATGDFKEKQVARAVKRSHLVGDVVEHYQSRAAGKRGITFAVDIESAHDLADAFNQAGVRAAAVSSKTPDPERHRLIKAFRNGELMQLCNVDLFGEGFDLPAIEVVSFARPTFSYPLYVQQFGRALRILAGKLYAIILDHVGNVERHDGPPDIPRNQTLDRREKARRGERDPDVIPTRICTGCTKPYPLDLLVCPYCDEEWVASRRDGPQQVDGDLIQLDRKILDQLYGQVRKVDESGDAFKRRMEYAGVPRPGVIAGSRRHLERQHAQRDLRAMMQMYSESQARDDRVTQKRFFLRYGVDVLTAQGLGRTDAERLAWTIIRDLGRGVL